MKNLLNSKFPYADNILKGKTALVCGASRGIGKATALMLARAGAQVIICARSSEELEKLSQEMYGDNHVVLILNLEDIPMVKSKITDLVRQQPIHILVNNSGGPPGGPLLSNTVDEFEGPFKRHLHAAHTITRILTPIM